MVRYWGRASFVAALVSAVFVSPTAAAPPLLAPTVGMSFSPSTVTAGAGSSSILSITVTNPNGVPLTQIAWTDTFPSGMDRATVFDTVHTCTGGVSFGITDLSIFGVTLGGGASCTTSMTVRATTPGTKINTNSVVTSLEAPNSATATASLTATGPPLPPTLFKFFNAEGLPRNGTTALQFILTNPNDVQALSGIGFTDSLPPSVLIATPNGLVGTCPGSVTAVAGGASVSLSGANLATRATCSFHINVTANTSGTKVNTTSVVTSIEAGSGSAATASLVVNAGPPTITTTSLSASANPSALGQSVTFTAAVTGAPTGAVTFKDGGSTLGVGTLSTSFLATFATSSLAAGNHTITAVYAGDTNYATSQSLDFAQTTNDTPTSTPTATPVATPTDVPTSSPAPTPTPSPTSSPPGSGGNTNTNSSKSTPPSPLGASVAVDVAAPAPPPSSGSAPVVVSQTLGGPSSPAPDLISFVVADSANHTEQVQIRLDPSVLSSLPASIQLRVVTDSAPTTDASPLSGGLGTSAAQPLAPPFDLRLVAQDVASGQRVALPDSVAASSVEVRLPLPAITLAAGDEATWLMEIDGPDGQFLGYVRPPASFDAATQQMVLSVPANQLRGTLFLPVVWRNVSLSNFDPDVHMWSSPFADAVDFGVAAPQWTRMQVLAPQVGQRLMVLNAFTGGPGWIDAVGVGQVGSDALSRTPSE